MKTARTMWLVLVLASAASAQNRATLVDAPLAVLMSMSEPEAQALQSDFRQALARHDAVLLPTRTSWNKVLAAVDRQDCGVHDACLQRLALASGSLYALFASVERNAAGTELTVTGRVVDRDGRRVRARVLPARAASGRASVQAALQELVLQLDLDSLPSALAYRPVVVAASPTSALALPELWSEPPPTRVAAWVTLGVAASAAAASLAFGLSAASQLSGLPADGRFISEDQARLQLEGNRSATIALGTGLGAGAVLATSLGLFWVSGPIKVSAGPTQSGGALFASGQF